ncbi:MAG: AAA family ATPase [Fimbriimonadaceae bacterium]|nr:AAA family ATPase [Fimbriimonadaceae bacterium]
MNSPLGDRLSQLIARLEEKLPAGDAKAANLLAALRQELQRMEGDAREHRELISQYEEAYQKLTQPANRIAVLTRLMDDDEVQVVLGDTDYITLVDSSVDPETLEPGIQVRLNEAYVVVGTVPEGDTGPLVNVGDVLADGRLRVGNDAPGSPGRLVGRAAALAYLPIKAGDEVRLDAAGRMAVEHFVKRAARDYFVEEVPETPWSKVGGQHEAIRIIRETIEHPLLYPEIYERFDKKPVKGILLYGPPGCGKTLIGKATAYNLAKDYSQRLGKDVKECFLHISGPKVLNMWLGETERMVREIFATARAKAKEGQLVVVFIDEAEAILRTRSSGRWLNISNTVVPQFCAEMDGLVELENVVLVITSNRPDYIDPAILRPERIDRKVKVVRPDKESSREILSIYLHERLPMDPGLVKEHGGEECARAHLVEAALEHLWRANKHTEFLKIQLRNGTTETLHWRDMVSGALLKSIVDRAKDAAIRRAVADPGTPHGLTLDDLKAAVEAEYRENEIFPKSDAAEDWLKLLDFEPEAVANVRPVKAAKGEDLARKSVI